MQAVIGFALAYMENAGAAVPFFLRSILNEVTSEIGDLENTESIGEYFLFCSSVMRWIATGETSDIPQDFLNTLPADVKQHLALTRNTV